MITYLKLVTVACAACFTTAAIHAADTPSAVATTASSPAGTWKWSQPGRDGATFDQTLNLDYKDGKLTGTLLGGQRPQGTVPDIAITNASCKDGLIAFSVAREFNGNTFVIKYEGKLDGDTIKGSSERPGRDGGEPQKRAWNAVRAR